MTKKLIVGNWKMHFTVHQASLFVHKLNEKVTVHRDVEAVLCPNFVALQSLSLQINHRQFKLGAQNCDWRDEGAFTGEVSAAMLRGLVKYVIIGHSERRHVFGEYHVDIRKKVQAAVRSGLMPILCVGETATERAAKETRHVLHDQVISGLANITSGELSSIIIAYEPVWAIGSGKVPTVEDIEKAVGYIRHDVSSLYGSEAAAGLRVLYGGSSTASNAAGLLSVDTVDGLLVGGASLHADEFAAIVKLAHDIQHKG